MNEVKHESYENWSKGAGSDETYFSPAERVRALARHCSETLGEEMNRVRGRKLKSHTEVYEHFDWQVSEGYGYVMAFLSNGAKAIIRRPAETHRDKTKASAAKDLDIQTLEKVRLSANNKTEKAGLEDMLLVDDTTAEAWGNAWINYAQIVYCRELTVWELYHYVMCSGPLYKDTMADLVQWIKEEDKRRDKYYENRSN